MKTTNFILMASFMLALFIAIPAQAGDHIRSNYNFINSIEEAWEEVENVADALEENDNDYFNLKVDQVWNMLAEAWEDAGADKIHGFKIDSKEKAVEVLRSKKYLRPVKASFKKDQYWWSRADNAHTKYTFDYERDAKDGDWTYNFLDKGGVVTERPFFNLSCTNAAKGKKEGWSSFFTPPGKKDSIIVKTEGGGDKVEVQVHIHFDGYPAIAGGGTTDAGGAAKTSSSDDDDEDVLTKDDILELLIKELGGEVKGDITAKDLLAIVLGLSKEPSLTTYTEVDYRNWVDKAFPGYGHNALPWASLIIDAALKFSGRGYAHSPRFYTCSYNGCNWYGTHPCTRSHRYLSGGYTCRVCYRNPGACIIH